MKPAHPDRQAVQGGEFRASPADVFADSLQELIQPLASAPHSMTQYTDEIHFHWCERDDLATKSRARLLSYRFPILPPF